MTKYDLPDEDASSSVSAKNPGFLHGLIDALHHLFIAISSRLRHAQIHRSPMGEAKGVFDIRKRLISHVEKISAEKHPEPNARPISKGTRTNTKRTPTNTNRHENTAAKALDINRLTEHSAQKAAKKVLPRMHEQLQKKTMEHINISLILAREGNINGAKLHIDLAENAMHTASRFMSHEEYEAFQQKVEHRLELIAGKKRSDKTEE